MTQTHATHRLSPSEQQFAARMELCYTPPVSASKVEAGGESPNEAATAALAPVSAAFSRLIPIHPRGQYDHADSLAARTGGAGMLVGASSISQPLYRAATTFESVAVASKTVTEARAMTQNQLVTVEFHGQSILAILHDGKPYVAMKPICKNIGLQWESQYNRIQRNHVMRKGIFITNMPSEGGHQEAVCLPLTMLNGWLFGVDVNRVKEEIRPKLIRYQEECFDVLSQHFMPKPVEGRPFNPAIDYERISPAQAQDLKEIVQAIVEAGVQGFGETWGRLHSKFRVNSYLQLPASRAGEARAYLLAKLPKVPKQPELPEASINVQGLLLEGQCDPVPLTAAQQALIDQHAGRLVGEAYPLIRAHFERRIAFCTNPAKRNDPDNAAIKELLNSATLGSCLAHKYHSEIRHIGQLFLFSQAIAEQATTGIRKQLGIEGNFS